MKKHPERRHERRTRPRRQNDLYLVVSSPSTATLGPCAGHRNPPMTRHLTLTHRNLPMTRHVYRCTIPPGRRPPSWCHRRRQSTAGIYLRGAHRHIPQSILPFPFPSPEANYDSRDSSERCLSRHAKSLKQGWVDRAFDQPPQ